MKFIKEHKILIVAISLILLIIIGLVLFLLSIRRDSGRGNDYNYEKEVIELPNTTTYKNEELTSNHCLNSICISDATFYYNDQMGRVEYKITNNSKKKKSGYLKMIFNNQTLIIVYKDLKPGETVNSRSQYMGIEIEDKSDYKLVELTKEEISKLVK